MIVIAVATARCLDVGKMQNIITRRPDAMKAPVYTGTIHRVPIADCAKY